MLRAVYEALDRRCKPNEAGKRARPTENVDDEVLLVPEAKVSNVSETQPTQRQKKHQRILDLI